MDNAQNSTMTLLAGCAGLREQLARTSMHCNRYLQVVRQTEGGSLHDEAVHRYSQATYSLLEKIKAMTLIVSMGNLLWRLKARAEKANSMLTGLQQDVDISGSDLYGDAWPLVGVVHEFVCTTAPDMTLALRGRPIKIELDEYVRAYMYLKGRSAALSTHFNEVLERVGRAHRADVLQAWRERRVVESLLETGEAAFRAVEIFRLAQRALPEPPATVGEQMPADPG